jgi:hypothetical protein
MSVHERLHTDFSPVLVHSAELLIGKVHEYGLMDYHASLAMTDGELNALHDASTVTASEARQSIPLAAHHQSVATESCVCQHTYKKMRRTPRDIKVFERCADITLCLGR